MSHIPSSAMPRAVPKSVLEGAEGSGSASKGRGGKVADLVRDNPKTAIAAGAAVVVGAAVAAAIPAIRARKKNGDEPVA